VSFSLPAGGIFGLVGSDGAGKTTLLRVIATILAPDSGSVTVAGRDVVRERSAVKELIGYMPQRFGLYQDLSVAENLDFFMDIYGIPAPNAAGGASAISDFPTCCRSRTAAPGISPAV